ncbi:MAG: hypothetical protein KDE03_08380 [Rhodobacteraceae bacterium]|nr:hypothetical protein [Paracoccaceae bacterium]
MLSRLGALLAFFLFATFGLSACVSSFQTNYGHAVPAETSRLWHVSDVKVDVPKTLTVSEQKSIFPFADIVWREDPPGDRRQQVGKIIADAARKGAAGLHGSRPVRLDIVVSRFHALTFEAEAKLSRSGVHNIDFTVTVVDARTGEVLAGPEAVEAALPALAGTEMIEARLRGESQKSQISDHLVKVFAGWLGVGPDPREKFTRLGG